MTVMNRVLAAALVVVGAALLGGCQATAGPTVGFRNESDTVMDVAWWVGTRDASRPGGAKMRRVQSMEVGPRGRAQSSLVETLEYRSAAASVVRVQIKPVGTSFTGAKEYWYEFAPPSPFVIRARRAGTGDTDGVGRAVGFFFEREGQGSLSPVPEEFWVKPSGW